MPALTVALGVGAFIGSSVASSTIVTHALSGMKSKGATGFSAGDPLRPSGVNLAALCGIPLGTNPGHKHAIDY